MKRFLTALCLAALASLRLAATTYYVSSSTGSDSNNGASQAAPWKTLAKVNSTVLAPGDSVLLARGDTWRESLVPLSSGTSANPIFFDAYGSGPAPLITGYQDLSSASWTLVSGNIWQTPLTATGINNALFATIWGQKQTSQSALQHDRDFYFSGNKLYIYSAGTPATYYASIAAITTAAGQLIYINGKSWLRFQHISLTWFDGFGVNIAGSSDHLLFANMESNGMVPAGTLPHGFYMNANSPGDISFYNVEAHLNYDGFKFDGSATSITLINCKAYANRDGGLVDNTAHATYSYSHFYANNIAIFNSQDIQGGALDGGNNLPVDTPPAVVTFSTYPARVTFTVDDVGFAPGTETYIDSLLPIFDARSSKLSAAVTTGYASGLVSEIQSWLSAGHDVNSHSWSHQYYTNTNAFTIRYTGSGTAGTLTISGNHLTTTVTGGPGGENLNYDLTDPAYDTATELVAAINTHATYTAALDINCRTAAHTIGLADVTSQDIKAATYTALFQKDRLEPDELASSKNWLQTNIPGLSNAKAFVYPDGIEDTQTQAWAAAAGYEGTRGALSIGLGSNSIYSKAVNIQNITSLSISGLHGLTAPQIDAKIAALVFKASVWGVPYGLFIHLNDLTPSEVATTLDSLIVHGAVVMTNTQLVDWIASTSNIAGTTNYVSAAPGIMPNLHLTAASPILNAGTNLGSSYQLDLAGVPRPAIDAWDIGAYAHLSSVYGTGHGPGTFTIGIPPSCGGPPNYCGYTGSDPVTAPMDLSAFKHADGTSCSFGNLLNTGETCYDTSFLGHSDASGPMTQVRLAPVTRCTDTNTTNSSTASLKYQDYLGGQGGSGGAVEWNANSTFQVTGNNFLRFDPATGQCAPHLVSAYNNLDGRGSATADFNLPDNGQWKLANVDPIYDPATFYVENSSGLIQPYAINWQNVPMTLHCASGDKTAQPDEFCAMAPMADLSLAWPGNHSSAWQSGHSYGFGQTVKYTLSNTECAAWAPGVAHVAGDLICPTNNNSNGYAYRAVKSFTTGAAEPYWGGINTGIPDNCTTTASGNGSCTISGAWKALSNASFVFQLTDISNCSPNCTPANTFTSGSTIPAFVMMNGHMDILHTVAETSGGITATWTDIGDMTPSSYLSASMVSRDGTRVSGAMSFNHYGSASSPFNYTLNGGQGSGGTQARYNAATNIYSHYNMMTGIIQDYGCTGGTGPYCTGGTWTETVLGRIAIDCRSANHGGKSGPTGRYIHASVGATISGNCGLVRWDAELKPGMDANWAQDVAVQNPLQGGFGHTGWTDNYWISANQNYNSWLGKGTYMLKIPATTFDDATTYVRVWGFNDPYPSAPSHAGDCDRNWTPQVPPEQWPPCDFGNYDNHLFALSDNGIEASSFYGIVVGDNSGLPITAPYQGEAIAVSLDPAKPKQWRFTHLPNTEANSNFSIQYEICQVSQDFKWMTCGVDGAPSANGSGTFGSTSGSSSCLGGYPHSNLSQNYPAGWMINPVSNLVIGGTGFAGNYGVFQTASGGTSAAVVSNGPFDCGGNSHCVWSQANNTGADNHIALPLAAWSSGTPALNSYILPIHNNAAGQIFKYTSVAGSASSEPASWCQAVGCTVTDAGGNVLTNQGVTDTVQDGTVTWTYQDKNTCRGDLLTIKLW